MRRSSLNHIYRLIWCDRLRAFVAVSEITRARGKRSSAAGIATAIVGATLSTGAVADGVTTAPGSAASVTSSRNGVDVVNIANPNSAGLSHNTFNDYNVSSSGLILNNIKSADSVGNTQLAGTILSNPNLSQSAGVILNEVVSTNRSVLQGYTEVAGPSADVVVANPYGISCSGCGFLNTGHVTLTTGVPLFASDGSLGGFNVSRGDIQISGDGLDGSRQNMLDLLTRSVQIAGQVNGKDLKVVVGTFMWDQANRSATATTAADAAPALAFDSTAVGGMYANRISIQVTEAGAGVRMLGDAAANGDDLTISAAGQLLVSSHLSAARDLSVTTTDNSNSTSGGALSAQDATLTAGRDLALGAANGAALIQGGLLYAGRNLGVNATQISDQGDNNSLQYNNQRYAAGAVTLLSSAQTSLKATSWTAEGDLSATAGAMTLFDGTSLGSSGGALSLTATQQDLALGGAAIGSEKDLTLTAAGAVTTGSSINQGVISSAGNLKVQAASLANAGDMEASTGNLTVNVSGLADNSGTLQSGQTLTVQGLAGSAASGFTNESGSTAVAGSNLLINAQQINNAGGLQGTAGSTVNASTLINTGTFIASATAGDAAKLNLATFNNSGLVQSADNLNVALTTKLDNSGQMLAAGDLAICAADSGGTCSSSAAAEIDNQSTGVLQAGGLLKVSDSQGNFLTQTGKVLGGSLDIVVNALSNDGLMQSDGDSTYSIGGSLTNTGDLLAAGQLTATAMTLTNAVAGAMEADGGASLTATGTLTNDGSMALYANPGDVVTIAADRLNNSGVLQSAGDLSANLATALNNTGTLSATGSLTINGTGTSLAITNDGAAALLSAGFDKGEKLKLGGNGVSLLNENGAAVAGNQLDFTLASLTNSGAESAIQAGAALDASGSVGTSTLNISGALVNEGGISFGSSTQGGSGSIAAASLTINNSGAIQSYGDLDLTAGGNVVNHGLVLALGDLTVGANPANASWSVSNDGANAVMQAGGQLKLGGSGLAVTNQNGGTLDGGTIAVNAQSLTNDGGTVAAETANGSSTISLSGDLNNKNLGLILFGNAGPASANISAANIINNASTLQSSGNLTLDVTGTLDNKGTASNSGLLLAAGTLDIEGTGASTLTVTNESDGVLQSGQGSASTLKIGGNIGSVTNAGGVYGGVLDVTAASLMNSGDLYGQYLPGSGASLNVNGTLTNSGTLVLGYSDTAHTAVVNTQQLVNQAGGLLQSGGDLDIELSSNVLSNAHGRCGVHQCQYAYQRRCHHCRQQQDRYQYNHFER